MEWTLLGDPHAKPDNLDKIGTLFDIAEDLGNPTIILGDLLDTKEVIRSKVYNFVLKRLQGSKLKFLILVGNHDWHNLDCLDHSLQGLKLLANVTVIDEPTLIDNMLFVPYMDKIEDFKKVIKSPEYSSTKILVMHQGVVGFDYGNGRIEEEGLEIGDLKRFKKVISGHFHKFQENKNLVYLGTPFSHSQGEANQEKFIAVFDPATLELDLAKTPFARHVTLEINCDDENAKSLIPKNSEDSVRVILTGKQENINSFNQNEFEFVRFIERPSDIVEFQSTLKEEDSNEVKFKKWADEIKKLDPETTLLGLQLLQEVQ